MIRKMLQAILCIILCPLLVAQQLPSVARTSDAQQNSVPATTTNAPQSLPEFVTIPKDTKIELIALDSISSATAAAGSSVRFAVAKDVAVDGAIVIPAGTPVTGTVTKVRRGAANHRWAELRIHIEDVSVGHSIMLRVSQWPSTTNQVDWGTVEICILFPIGALFLKHLQDDGWGEDGAPKPNARSGTQAVLPMCVSFGFWVASAKSIPKTELRMDDTGSTPHLNVACPQILEESQIYDSPGLERLLFR